jgi:hypothetical protein
MPVNTRSQKKDSKTKRFDMVQWEKERGYTATPSQSESPKKNSSPQRSKKSNVLDVSKDVKELHKLFSRLSLK